MQDEIMLFTYLIEHCANDIYVGTELEMNDRNIRSGLGELVPINLYPLCMGLLCLFRIPCTLLA